MLLINYIVTYIQTFCASGNIVILKYIHFHSIILITGHSIILPICPNLLILNNCHLISSPAKSMPFELRVMTDENEDGDKSNSGFSMQYRQNPCD